MAPDKKNMWNYIIAVCSGIGFSGIIYLGGKTVDTVNFVSTTKNTNTEFPAFQKMVVSKFDTLFLFMHDIKMDNRKRNEAEYVYKKDLNAAIKTCEPHQ